jgi:maltooligosyltrehalose trehalohydrolase
MGEEWGTRRPFQYFTDHSEPELASAVREGRRREFQAFGWAADDVPDPQEASTFERSRLDWDERGVEEHAELLRFYQALISLRRNHPSLRDDRLDHTVVRHDEAARWLYVCRGDVCVVGNFADQPCSVPLANARGAELLLSSDPGAHISATHVSLPGVGVAILRLAPELS